PLHAASGPLAVTITGNGAYSATAPAHSRPAVVTSTGTVNGAALGSATITFGSGGGTPGPADAAHSSISVPAGTISADGTTTAHITVTLRDASGAPLTTGGDTVTLSDGSGPLTVTSNGDGTYGATEPAHSSPAVVTITGTLNGAALASATITFGGGGAPGPASAATSTVAVSPSSVSADGTSTSTVTVRLKDASGTSLTAGGDAVTVSDGTSSLAVTDNHDGTYTATVGARSSAATVNVSATVNASAIAA